MKTNFNANFMQNLTRFRKNQGLSQSEVADKLKIARTTYQSYEKGRNEPSLEILLNLSKLYKVSVDELLGKEIGIESIHKRELLRIINQLNDIECRKLFNYAEGIIMNRQAEQRQTIYKILQEEENNG